MLCTCMFYPVMCRDNLDLTKPNKTAQNRRQYSVLNDIVQVLTSLLFNRAEKDLLNVQKRPFLDLCRNITIRLPCIAGFLCRAIFRGCAEIEFFGDIFTSAQHAFLMIELHLQYNLLIVRKADNRTYQIVTRVWETIKFI